ncbi:hypothetical protein HGP28_16080 [Vibrio sp. SM6]|uniref:Uncharacterized protein n=1 Tax=Vibrio agarilyticus TaxID=2726741 RepID=A0A7X8TT78_9VIBR|nr:hypothetical protein [Vibrio agarilyticus]NLS14399.1 hypothetical protein [Vibrio agarilyticus]
MMIKLLLIIISLGTSFIVNAHSSICTADYIGEHTEIRIFDINARPTVADLMDYKLVVTAQDGIIPYLNLQSLPEIENLTLRTGEAAASDEVKFIYVSPDNHYHVLEVGGRANMVADHEGNYHGHFFFQTQRPLLMYQNADVEMNVRIHTNCEH